MILDYYRIFYYVAQYKSFSKAADVMGNNQPNIAEDSGGTAIVRCEEGGDDVKSARPLRPGLHTCYNGGYRRRLPGDRMLIPKTSLSSDRSLQPDFVKLDSLVIAHQPWRGEYVPGPCTHRPSSHESRGYLKYVTARSVLG